MTPEETLIERYRERLTKIYTNPNPYVKHPEIERKEILDKIKELERK
ncbi:MAG: hypothetical protein IPJ02_17805 [Chitinophagaceae bacterium]|nr:hypothetical protein [Chitinophagaceae bacterium]